MKFYYENAKSIEKFAGWRRALASSLSEIGWNSGQCKYLLAFCLPRRCIYLPTHPKPSDESGEERDDHECQNKNNKIGVLKFQPASSLFRNKRSGIHRVRVSVLKQAI
jgi:hypothetical protein